MALPLIGVIIFTISCTEKQTKTEQVDKETQKKIVEAEEKIYQYMEADVEPQFPGGQKEFMNYIINEINYPEQSKLDGIEGRVFIKFIISKTGEIINASVASSVNETLDAEALRVVSGMPKWTPGEIEGQPVNVEFVVPIHFKLE
ncbi:MAG: energy transducer TonB [Bacteroidales bacterium]|nr:energy transducer TonB [Bacteroidales bacterium]